jgi:hypothetical protein
VFGLLRQGDGRIIITASFEDKMQTVRLPSLESEDSAWDFFEILFEELRCEPFYERTAISNEEKFVDQKHKTSTKTSTTTLTFSAASAGLSPPLHRLKKEEQVGHTSTG